MNKENKNFLIFLSLAAVILMGVISQNVVSAIKPKAAQLKIDVDKVKQEIEAAGLTLREAMYWKEL